MTGWRRSKTKADALPLALLLASPVHAANLTSGGPASSSGENTQQLVLSLPPGVGGVKPSLSLVYGHRGGMGELGFGWSLPISSVVLDRSTPDPLNDPTWRLPSTGDCGSAPPPSPTIR